jgi:hypothetical protein
MGHYVRNITLFNRNISSVYHIVAMRVIKHPGHMYRGFGSAFLEPGYDTHCLANSLQVM